MKKTLCILAIFVSTALMARDGDFKIPMPSQAPTVKIPASFQNSFNTSYKSAIGFEKNKGQWPDQVEYKTDLGGGRRLFLEKNKFTYVVHNPAELYQVHEAEHDKRNKSTDLIKAHAFEMVFLNASPSNELLGGEMNSFHYNYFIGNDPSKWATNVPVFKTLTYKNLYPGIDLVAYENDHNFKYDYVLQPGVDAKNIQLQFNGLNNLEIKNKNLYMYTSVGELIESVPYAYQVIDGREVKVECEYQLDKDGKTVSFYLPNGYDLNYALIIDPVVVASTYSGSTSTNYGHCATYDNLGNIYTGGRSFGTGYPVTIGAAQVTFGGSVDICISKLNPTGSTLLYATYLGGSSADYPHSMFVTLSGELYMYGTTQSANYPVSTGCYDGTHNGQSDMVVSKLNINGTTLLGSTYIGGTADDGINNNASYNYGDDFRGEIVVNTAGEVFIASTSSSANFPVSNGAYDVAHGGLQDVVVLKMNTNLTTLQWATFLGGTGDEAGCSIRLNGTGEVYVVGLTTGNGFPVVTPALNATYQGGTYDGFVARLDPSGATLLNSTFIGTGVADIAYFVEVDTYNGIYIYGITEGTIPTTAGVYSNPGSQTFLMKLNPSLSTVLFSTVLGNGSHGSFSPSALMVDVCQNIYMAGSGSNTGYPLTASANQATTTGVGFHIIVLSQNANTLLYGSHFGSGGEHVDGGTSRFDPNGVVYQAVCACNSTFPTTPGAFSPNKLAPSCDIVVFKIDFEVNCNPMLSNTVICYGSSATLSVTNVNNLINPTYSMQPGGISNGSGTFVVTPTVTTSYTLFVTGTNGFNVVVTNTGISTVTVGAMPQIAPTTTQSSCTSNTNAISLNLNFLPATLTPTYNILWQPIPSGLLPSQITATGGIAAGIYNATVMTVHGCSVNTSFTVNPVPAPAIFTITGPYIITCANPTVTVNTSEPSYTYLWSGSTATLTGTSANFTVGQGGNWTVIGTHPTSGCVETHSFTILQNITVSTATIAPLVQNITCSLTSVTTVTAVGNPSVNVIHYWLSPFGGTLTSIGSPANFLPGTSGTYTHVLINSVNGCSVVNTFSVMSTSGFPTFSVTSPQNFTLGCSTKSFAVINIDGGQSTPPGTGLTYTIIGPPTSTTYVPGTPSNFTVTVPGTWTVITKDINNLCESKVQISVLQQTVSPDLQVSMPRTRLDCRTPSVVLNASSSTPNVGFTWSFPGTPGNLISNSITVNANTLQVTNTLTANYSLTILNNISLCKSYTVIPIEQNLFKPNAVINGLNQITCTTQSFVLTNGSTSNVPPVFSPSSPPVIGYLWSGPTPQVDLQNSSSYNGQMPGTYTMVAQDNLNGCFAVATKTIVDFRVYPKIQKTEDPFIFDCGSDGAEIFPTMIDNASNYTYQWSVVPSASFTSLQTMKTTVNQPGQYNVFITNPLNGCTSMAMVAVINGTLDAAFVLDKVEGYAPLSVTFTNTSASSSTVDGTENINAYWNYGNGTKQIIPSTKSIAPSALYSASGIYTVTLFVQKGKCMDSTFKTIQVDIPSELVVPNIFTPNGDGNNDLFFVRATNLDKIDITIIDRWGHLAYKVSSATGNISWDGMNPYGKECAEGVYMYTLKATGKDGGSYDKKGTITLVR